MTHNPVSASSAGPSRLNQAMSGALARNEFVLHYEPIFEPATRAVVAVEALMRWQCPTGMVPPGEFIPAAEANGSINSLGAWALKEACRQLSEWDAQGLPLRYISVNVAPVQLAQPDFGDMVLQTIEDARIDATRILLEVTESSALVDPVRTGGTLAWLHRLGVRIALDDFGTGYASLSQLRKLPLSVLKIDRAFVNDIADTHQARSIVRFIISLAHELGLTTVAEGVETEAQLAALTSLGCDATQGWLVSKALHPDALKAAFEADKLQLKR